MFNSPNTAAMMGVVPMHRRGIAAGARVMLQNTGAVISIAFVMAIVTAAVPKDVLFKIFSGLTSGLSTAQLDPFISNMHLALWVLAGISLLGAGVSMLRPAHVARRRRRRAAGGSSMIRIGEVAERTGVTPRTIRYYEEIGLLPGGRAREGQAPHLRRDATSSALERADAAARPARTCRSTSSSSSLEAEEARAELRRRFETHRVRRRAARDRSTQALPHVETQLELVRRRKRELERLEARARRQAQARSTPAGASCLTDDGHAGPGLDRADAREEEPARANSASSDSPLSAGSETSRPPAVCAS